MAFNFLKKKKEKEVVTQEVHPETKGEKKKGIIKRIFSFFFSFTVTSGKSERKEGAGVFGSLFWFMKKYWRQGIVA